MCVCVCVCSVHCEEKLIKWKMWKMESSHRCHSSSCYCFLLTSASSVSPKCVLCAHVWVCICTHKTTEGQRVMACLQLLSYFYHTILFDFLLLYWRSHSLITFLFLSFFLSSCCLSFFLSFFLSLSFIENHMHDGHRLIKYVWYFEHCYMFSLVMHFMFLHEFVVILNCVVYDAQFFSP